MGAVNIDDPAFTTITAASANGNRGGDNRAHRYGNRATALAATATDGLDKGARRAISGGEDARSLGGIGVREGHVDRATVTTSTTFAANRDTCKQASGSRRATSTAAAANRLGKDGGGVTTPSVDHTVVRDGNGATGATAVTTAPDRDPATG